MADTNKTTNTPDLGDKPELGNGKDGSGSYQMRVGFGTIAMLISATGMGSCRCSAAGLRAPTCSTGRRA